MRSLLAFSLAFACGLCRAQDCVVTKEGRRIECRILEERGATLILRIGGKRYSVKKADLREWSGAGGTSGRERPAAPTFSPGPDRLFMEDGTVVACEILSAEGNAFTVRVDGVTAAVDASEVERWEKGERPETAAQIKSAIDAAVRNLARPRKDDSPIRHGKLAEELAPLLRRTQAREYAVYLLRYGPKSARGWLALSLALSGSKEAASDVIERFRSHPPADIPTPLIEAVGRFGGNEAAKALAEALPHLTSFKRLKAIDALGRTRSRLAVRALLRLVEGDDAQLRAAASVALIALGRKSPEVAREIAQRAGTAEKTAEYVRMVTYLDDPSNLSWLRRMLFSQDSDTATAAAAAAGYYRDARSANRLLGLLTERSGPLVLRLQCAASLKNIGDDSIVPGLVELLGRSGEDPRLRRAVHDSLKGLTGKDIPANASLWRRVAEGEGERSARAAPAARTEVRAGSAPAAAAPVTEAAAQETAKRTNFLVLGALAGALVLSIAGHKAYTALRK